MKYSVPAGDGECLFYPPRDQVPRLVEENHRRLEGYDFHVAEASFRSLRAATRQKVVAQAGRIVSNELRIVVGAHQPGFHGPGILCKHAALQRLSRGNLCVNFVVDSDVCEQISVKVPYLRGKRVGVREVVIFPNPAGLVFEELFVPPRKEVDLRYNEIEGLLESAGREEMLSAFREFRAVHHRVYREGDCSAKVLTDYRQGYYPTPDVHNSFISTVSRSEEFLVYACDIIRKIEKFSLAYNSSLKEHRRLHRIRSPVNPFPDLRREGELWELPFWSLDDSGRRRRVFAGGGGRFVVVEGGAGKTFPIRREALLSLRLRPRAVSLTMFVRLFVGDLFIHGVGGGNYDQVTDKIIEAYYGESPPAYVVCSRTKFLSGDRKVNLEQKVTKLRQKLREMKHNPEKFAPGGDALVGEALRILSECEGRPSAEEHLRLGEARRTLLERIIPQMILAENELAEAEGALQRQAAFHHRDFPYFLYPRSQL